MKLVNIVKDPKIKVTNKIELFLNPDFVYLPLSQDNMNIKLNSRILKNAYVEKNSNVTSSVSGIVKDSAFFMINHKKTKCLIVENDYKEEKIRVETNNIKDLTYDDLIKILEKHNDERLFSIFRNFLKAENIVINIVDDEPFVKNKIMIFKEYISECLEMLDKLKVIYKSNNNYIVVKNTDSEIIEECLNMIGIYPDFKITLVNDLYLLGQKEFLLPHLKMNIQDTLYLSVADLMKVHDLIYFNRLDTTKILTINGDALETGLVLRAKKYTLLEEIVHKFVKLKDDDVVYIANGLMRGRFIDIKNAILTDEIDSLTIMKKKEVKQTECLNCGKCVSICPVEVDPIKCYRNNKKDIKCINCGLCSYICPAYINLAKYVKEDTYE